MAILLSSTIIILIVVTSSVQCLQRDGGATIISEEARSLLELKSHLSDESGFLKDWSSLALTHPCYWTGVVCSNNSIITGLNFSSFGLAGSLSSEICKLPNLTSLDLYFNNFTGPFPSELLNCTPLQHLNLAFNIYTGLLPADLDLFLPGLQFLDLSYNSFSGPIPDAFGRLSELRELDLHTNYLNGTIPPSLGQLKKLEFLRLAENPLSPGIIPVELGNLTSLRYFWARGCNLIGAIPSSLGNLLALSNLDLSRNSLSGPIPASIFNVKVLYQLELYNNDLEGPLPANIGNLTALVNLDLAANKITGPVPLGIAQLRNLQSLNLYNNQLVGTIPAGLQDLPFLDNLSLFKNSFSGTLPPNLGKASKLLVFDVSNNYLEGPLPSSLCEGRALQVLVTMNNRFNGTIPSGVGSCRSLQRLRMGNNLHSGVVPSGVWGLPAVSIIELHNNKLEGPISSDIRNAANLSTLRLDNNRFSGSLPLQIGYAWNLTLFSIANNHFTGSIPFTLGKLRHLSDVHFQSNSFSGEIPEDMATCVSLMVLNLASNELSGSIPDFLGEKLVNLNTIDLSHNKLTGEVPPSLEALRLIYFDVSYNRLRGEVPTGFIGSAFDESFKSNEDLCGQGLVGVKECDGEGHSRMLRDHKAKWLLQAVLAGTFASAFVVLVTGLTCLYRMHKAQIHAAWKKRRVSGPQKATWSITSFHKLGCSESEILCGLDEDNIIGSGASGQVYRTTLKNGETIAIKKLWSSKSDQSKQHNLYHNIHVDRGFNSEVATLGKIRHKNIVKLLCSCSDADTKLLVYEYMPNGSLGDLLHSTSTKAGMVLDWPSRYRIALGAAQGLAYLHHDCCPPIVHRDVKSNNILLDAELNAHVADFGVAKVMQHYATNNQQQGPPHDSVGPDYTTATSSPPPPQALKQHNPLLSQQPPDLSLFMSSCIAGSYGYIAPEHAYTAKVTEKSDIYSFGVVMLELVTGKRPIVPEVFGENTDIVKWVCTKLTASPLHHGDHSYQQDREHNPSHATTCKNNIMEVLDPRLNFADCHIKEDMMLVLRIALLCTSSLPSSRPSMREVVDMLVEADPKKQRWVKAPSSKNPNLNNLNK